MVNGDKFISLMKYCLHLKTKLKHNKNKYQYAYNTFHISFLLFTVLLTFINFGLYIILS